MLNIYINFKNVIFETIGYYDTDDSPHEMRDIVTIPVCIPVEDIDDWLAAYDPDSEQSPSATDSRKIARAVLDALKRASE